MDIVMISCRSLILLLFSNANGPKNTNHPYKKSRPLKGNTKKKIVKTKGRDEDPAATTKS